MGSARVPAARVTSCQAKFSAPRAKGCLSADPMPPPSAPQRSEESRPSRPAPSPFQTTRPGARATAQCAASARSGTRGKRSPAIEGQ